MSGGGNIFADNAPRYWEAGLPVIPLLPKEKRPGVAGWQLFSDSMPNAEQQEVWLRHFARGNIGLPLGKQSGLVAIDIDTDDPKALAIIDRLLPKSPWQRIGKKGMVRIYRYSGEKPFRIQGIVELLSKGTQVVLPPSIHPDTGVAYKENVGLLEAIRGGVPALPLGLDELMRESLREEGFAVGVGGGGAGGVTKFIPAGSRDNSMIWHAGLLARDVVAGRLSLFDALGQMQVWADSYVENVIGDPLDINKGYRKIIEFMLRDVTVGGKMLPIGWDDGLSEEMRAELGLGEDIEEHRQWSATEMLDYLSEGYREHSDPNGDEMLVRINLVLQKLVGDSLSVLEVERILKFISSQSGGVLTLAALRRQLKDFASGQVIGTNHNEIAEAVKTWFEQFGQMRFQAGQFWRWNGSHWAPVSENQIVSDISREFGALPVCKTQRDYVAIMKLLKALIDKPLADVNLKGINFANGFLDEFLELREHAPEYGQTYVLDYRYLPEEEGRMPLFNQYLNHSWGEDVDASDKIMALQEAIGATLFGVAPGYQKAFCLYGAAGSGKSVMSKIVRSLVPKNQISAVPPEKWSDTFLPAEMFGKVLNFAGELSEDKYITGKNFKEIIEGEKITAQRKNQQPFEFEPYCAHWFNSNHLPKTTDMSNGFNRRWLFLEWPRSVPEEKRIIGLDQIIVDSEREAIAAWAVIGYMRLRKQGHYTIPASHNLLDMQMAIDNNSVRYFLEHSPRVQIRTGGENVVTATALYELYWEFCLASGVVKRVSWNTFVSRMKEMAENLLYKHETSKGLKGGVEVRFKGISIVAG